MEVFFSLSKHCRCGFNSLGSRCTAEKQKWKRNSETNKRRLPGVFATILNRKWTENLFIKYHRQRRNHKTNLSVSNESISKPELEENLETIIVDNVCADLSVPGSCKSEAWRSIFVDLTKKGSMTYLIFVDQETLYPEVFELGVRSLWKQTKQAFRDVFREYRIPVEIRTSEKMFFGSGKFLRFIKDHGIVMTNKSDAENNLANVLANVKVLIHNSRFWHEELRKLRKSISKRLSTTEDKYVQVDDVCEDDMKFSMSDSSSEDSSERENDVSGSVKGKCNNYQKDRIINKEIPKIKSVLLSKRKQIIGNIDTNNDIVMKKGEDWLHCLRKLSIKANKCQNNGFCKNISNKVNSNIVDISKNHPVKISWTRNFTRIHHCEIDEMVPIPGIWKRTKNKLIKKINYYCHNHEGGTTFQEEYGEMFNYLSKSSRDESTSNEENSQTITFSRSNEMILKLGQKGSGDNGCSDGDVHKIATCMHEFLIRFPIEMLPYKYDNLYITQNDLNWKAVVMDVIEISSKCYYMFIDCATNFPELFLQIENKGNANVEFLINALCRLWQIHGKPIEIHSPNGILFSSTKLSKFMENYDIFFYYDSPFLRNDMKIGHIWIKYKNILGNGNTYAELLRIQRNIRKITKERERREEDKKRQRTLFSLNKTTIEHTTDHLITKAVEGILQKETINFTQNITWRKIILDLIHCNDNYYIIFIDIETLYPEIKEIKYSSSLRIRLLIRTFKKFFTEKSTPEEIYVGEKLPFNTKDVIGFMERIGVNYYRQSHYFNGGSCLYKCLEHMKSVICHSTDLNSAIYNCKKKLLPWLGLSPQQMARSNRENTVFNRIVSPWDEIIIDVFTHGETSYLIVFDYDSLYSECFPLSRNIFKSLPAKVIRSCEKSFSVLGCPSKLWTFDRDFTRSNSFSNFLRIRAIQHYFLTSQKEREASSLLASLRQKFAMTGSLRSALVSTRTAYNHFIGACPVRRLREKETAVNEVLKAATYQRKHVRFNLSENRFNDLFSSDSEENF